MKLINGECLEEMEKIKDKSIDMILCDLPYSIKNRQRVTGNKWDLPIDIDRLWSNYKRIIKDDGAIVLTASQPFAGYLIMSNIDMFKYDIIWEKESLTNFTSVNHQVGRVHESVLIFTKGDIEFKINHEHESILVFGKGATTYNKKGEYMKYNPQKTPGKPYTCKSGRKTDNLQGGDTSGFITKNTGERHPKSVQKFKRDRDKLHPTQKPVALFEFLIKSYTNEGDTVLDNCFGSGTTGVACKNTNRKFIGIELKKEYFEIAKKRIENTSHN